MKPGLLFLLLLSVTFNRITAQEDDRYRLADSLLRLEKCSEAMVYLEQIIAEDSSDQWALTNAMTCAARQADYNKCYKYSRQLLATAPRNAQFLNAAGWYALLNRDYLQSKKYLYRALEQNRNDYSIYLNLGHVYRCTKDEKRWKYFYQNAVEYLPGTGSFEKIIPADFDLLRQINPDFFDSTDAEWAVGVLRRTFLENNTDSLPGLILDSIYQLKLQPDADASEILRLKKAFCDADGRDQRYRGHVVSDFLWDIGRAEYTNGSESIAMQGSLARSQGFADMAKDTSRYIKHLLDFNEIYQAADLDAAPLALPAKWQFVETAYSLAEASGDKFQQLLALKAMIDIQEQLFRPEACSYYSSIFYQVAANGDEEDFVRLRKGKAEALLSAHNLLSKAHPQERRCDSALIHLERYLELGRKHDIPVLSGIELTSKRIFTLNNCGRYTDAIAEGKALFTDFKRDSTEDRYNALLNLAPAYEKTGDSVGSAEVYEEALQAFHCFDIKRFRSGNRGVYYNNLFSQECRNAYRYLGPYYSRRQNIAKIFELAERFKENVMYTSHTGLYYPQPVLSVDSLTSILGQGEAAISLLTFEDAPHGASMAVTDHRQNLSVQTEGLFMQTGGKEVAAFIFQRTGDFITRTMRKIMPGHRMKRSDSITYALLVASAWFNEYMGIYRSKSRGLTLRDTVSHSQAQRDIKALNDFLYRFYIQPHEALLKDCKRLYISPHQVTTFIPFEALRNPDGRYLGELYEIIYVPSFTARALEKKPVAPSNRMLLAGNPSYTSFSARPMTGKAADIAAKLGVSEWADLPGTKAEIDTIAALYRDADVLQGTALTESALKQLSDSGKLAGYRYLHLALHGVSVQGNFAENSIVLTEPANGANDGFMQFFELANLDIAAELVCLSACETSLFGGMMNMATLPVAMMMAGARKVVATSWAIDDKATSVFMNAFYRGMFIEKRSASESLHQVRKDFINGVYGENYRAPKYWAAFRLYEN